jgi:hypothetical protein
MQELREVQMEGWRREETEGWRKEETMAGGIKCQHEG